MGIVKNDENYDTYNIFNIAENLILEGPLFKPFRKNRLTNSI